jgi:chromosome segregation ATPase
MDIDMEPEPLEPVRRLAQPVTRREGMEEKRRQIEELIEGIVEERWADFRMELGSIMSQFSEISDRISRLEQSSKDKDSYKTSDLDALEKRMESYNSSVEDISSRMGAMENAIKSSMTPMMQTLRSLSDTIKSLKDDEKGSRKVS